MSKVRTVSGQLIKEDEYIWIPRNTIQLQPAAPLKLLLLQQLKW